MPNFAVTKNVKKMKKVISILVLSISLMCGLFISGQMKAAEKDEEKISVEVQTVKGKNDYESLKPSIPKKYPETNNEWFKPEVFWDLDRNGSLSRKNIFDCLTSDVKTYDALYSKMREKFPEKVDSIKACFSRYGIIEDVEEPVTEDVTFSGRTVSESTTVTGTNISVQDVSVINGAKLTLVGNVSIGSTFFVESGSSLEIRQR